MPERAASSSKATLIPILSNISPSQFLPTVSSQNTSQPATMTKRKRPSNGPAETDDEPKRPRGDNAHAAIKQSVSHGRVDPTSGQRSAIPGLDDDDYGGGESDLEYGTEMEDALSYLRSVR